MGAPPQEAEVTRLWEVQVQDQSNRTHVENPFLTTLRARQAERETPLYPHAPLSMPWNAMHLSDLIGQGLLEDWQAQGIPGSAPIVQPCLEES